MTKIKERIKFWLKYTSYPVDIMNFLLITNPWLKNDIKGACYLLNYECMCGSCFEIPDYILKKYD